MFTEKLSSRDWELLSSYLDDELDPRQKARVEARLNSQPEFKEALEGLRRTKFILRKAQVRKVPHNFIVTAADVAPVKSFRWIPTLQWSSAAVALAAVFLFASQLVPGFSGFSGSAAQKAAESNTTALEAALPTAAAEASGTPEVIYWGGPPMQAYGMGGGGGDTADKTGIGGGPLEPVATAFPQPPLPNTYPDLQIQPTNPPRLSAAAPAEPVTGTGPILGIRPQEQQGEALADNLAAITPETSREAVPDQRTTPWVGYAAGGLLVVAAGLMTAAILLKRKLSG
jgi:hypothetical protein